MKKKNTFWFKIISISLPFLLFLIVELAFRILNVGDDLSLFVDHPENEEFLIFNSKVSRRYFVNEQNATAGYSEPFMKEKEASTFRIFVQGGSTAFGFPYEHNGSFHRMLQYQFNQNFPERKVEIINLSLTAVNSYTLLDFVDEIIEQDPDAVLIYAGHNEFYGALGVGSTSKLGHNPTLVRWGIRFRKLRLGRMLSNLIQTNQDELTEESGTLMKRMVAEQGVKNSSKLYQRGVDQFNQNVSLLLAKYKRNQVPVFIGKLTSNLKDQPPFASDTTLKENAEYYFERGKQTEEAGDYGRALQYFIQAKEQDLLPFRAPEVINEKMELLAKEHGAVIVPVDEEFALNSPHGIVGNELILEHLHPNLQGYYLLSTSFYKALVKELRFIDEGDRLSMLPIHELPITQMDSMLGHYQNVILRSQWPFNEPLPNLRLTGKSIPAVMAGGLIDKKISWNEAMEQLSQYYRKKNDQENLLKVAESFALSYPLDQYSQLKASELAIAQKKYSKAFVYFRTAFMLAPEVNLLKNCVRSGLYSQDFDGILNLLNAEKVRGVNNFSAEQTRKDISTIKQLEYDLKSDPFNTQLLSKTATMYYDYRVFENALASAENLLVLQPGNELAKKVIEKINK